MIIPGFFGKLPSMGDFVSRGWQAGTREGLDKLLQEAIAALMASSTAGKEALAQAPCSALSIRPGAIGEQGLVCVVMPSQDRVGRVFPLCAGVQWTAEGKDSMRWPPPDFARNLIGCVHRCVDASGDPDSLLAGIAAVGSPDQFQPTLQGLGGEETLPKLGAEIKLLRLQGPLARLPPGLAALCSMLSDASDLLGIRFDLDGGVQDFFVCRRIESGSALASMFDGRWAERGWKSFDAPGGPDQAKVASIPEFDDDVTQPRHRTIDTLAAPPDSPDTL